MGFEESIDRLIYSTLTANATLMAAVKGVYDYVDESERTSKQSLQWPFVAISDPAYVMDDTFEGNAYSGQITIHVWSRQKGRQEISRIKDLIYATLHKLESAMEGGKTLIYLHCESSSTTTQNDGITRLGEMVFNILVEG
jgi:hypothetical protein